MDLLGMLRKASAAGGVGSGTVTTPGQGMGPYGASSPTRPGMQQQVANAASSPLEPKRNEPGQQSQPGQQPMGALGTGVRNRIVAMQADKIGRKLVGFKQLDPASPINYNQAKTAVFTDPEVTNPDEVWRYMHQVGMVVPQGGNVIDPVAQALQGLVGKEEV